MFNHRHELLRWIPLNDLFHEKINLSIIIFIRSSSRRFNFLINPNWIIIKKNKCRGMIILETRYFFYHPFYSLNFLFVCSHCFFYIFSFRIKDIENIQWAQWIFSIKTLFYSLIYLNSEFDNFFMLLIAFSFNNNLVLINFPSRFYQIFQKLFQ